MANPSQQFRRETKSTQPLESPGRSLYSEAQVGFVASLEVTKGFQGAKEKDPGWFPN